MEITLLIKSIMGLIVILALLIFLFFYSPRAKVKREQKKYTHSTPDKPKEYTLDQLRAIIRNRASSRAELKEAIGLVIKHYGVIHKKLGSRPHPDFDAYMEMLIMICRHPNTNKNLIINFDRELSKLNPDYKSDINDAITKGLNSRGI
jgi:hypothetical protein